MSPFWPRSERYNTVHWARRGMLDHWMAVSPLSGDPASHFQWAESGRTIAPAERDYTDTPPVFDDGYNDYMDIVGYTVRRKVSGMNARMNTVLATLSAPMAPLFTYLLFSRVARNTGGNPTSSAARMHD